MNFQHPNFDAVDVVNPSTGGLNIQGLALVPFMRATNGCTRARRLTFTGMATMGTTGKTVVQGYYFTDNSGTNKKSCIINFSDQVVTLNLNNVYPNNSQLTVSGQRSSISSSSLPIRIGDHVDPRNNVTLQPYSVNFIRP